MRLIPLASLGLVLVACRATAPRYIVTAAPLDTGATTPKLCIAVDPTDRHGIWWWEPGHPGCSTRSTGPDVFHAEDAAVVRQPSGAIDCRFRLQLIAMPGSPDVAAVAFVVDESGIHAVASGARVPIARRSHLRVPFAAP
jgi:hypothetical protein